MWSALAIITVAVGSSLVLLVAGVCLAVNLERRRYRRLMQDHVSARRLSTYHRTQLSASENNYEDVPQPETNPRQDVQPYGIISAAWRVIPSQENLKPQIATIPEHGEIDVIFQPTRRRRSLRQTLYGHPFHVPKTRRQKKIDRAISLKQMAQSTLSAITESTDSTLAGPQVPAELQTLTTPRVTPEKTHSPHQQNEHLRLPPVVRTGDHNFNVPGPVQDIFSGELRRSKSTSQSSAQERPSFGPRSVSMTSTLSIAPDTPLPPLPTIDISKHSRAHEPKWRTSTGSLDTVGSSVLGTVMSSPSCADTELTVPFNDINSGLQHFDFGLVGQSTSARLGVPLGRQTISGLRNGKPGIASIRPSLDFNSGRTGRGRQSSIRLGTQGVTTEGDSLKTIDASTWNPGSAFEMRLKSCAASTSTRQSMYEPSIFAGQRNLGACGQELNASGKFSPYLMPPRPASVAGGAPMPSDQRSPFATCRLSVASSESIRKCHRRQNCIRITNLPPIEALRASKIMQMPEVVEEQLEAPTLDSVSIPGLSLLEAGQPILRARASLVDVKGSPSPLYNRPIFVPPTRPKGPPFFRAGNSALSGIPRPDSDVFNTAQPDLMTPNVYMKQNSRQWPLSSTSPNHIRSNSAAPLPQAIEANHGTPVLPLPTFTSASLFPRKSLVKGPRNPPASRQSPRTGSPSPIQGKHLAVSRRPGLDLRKSVIMLRSMNSEGHLLDHSSRIYRNIGEEQGSGAHPAMNYSRSPTHSELSLFPNDGRGGSTGIRNSRSKGGFAISPSAMSMGGASIWEDASVREDSPEPEMPNPKPLVVLKSYNAQTPGMGLLEHDPEAYENMVDSQSISGKVWGRRNACTNPQGEGLGLRMGNALLGTPGSLYDGDGFLKE